MIFGLLIFSVSTENFKKLSFCQKIGIVDITKGVDLAEVLVMLSEHELKIVNFVCNKKSFWIKNEINKELRGQQKMQNKRKKLESLKESTLGGH